MKKKYITPNSIILTLSADILMLDTSGGSTGGDERETKYFNSIIGEDISEETDGD